MGKFNDTKYTDTVDNLVSASNDKINNPYYKFSDKKPTKVTYYSQNIEKSTLDQASGLYGSHIGTDSPFKFNKINNFLLYGIERITVDYDLGDFGLSSDKIMGNCILLPNTIIPRPGDFFSISYIKEDILFKVTEVKIDTLDTGANIYSIEYKLSRVDHTCTIEEQVVAEFDFIVDNAGTDFNTIIRSSDCKLIDIINRIIDGLITKFESLFFDSKLQTFIVNKCGSKMYDPFMIEFIIRNNVLNFGDNYIHVSHAMSTNKTFSMDYLKTFFYSLENPKEKLECTNIATADLITDINSLFVTRLDKYYWIRYCDNTPYKTRFFTINSEVINRIVKNEPYEKNSKDEIYNLWIAYFNDTKMISEDMLSLLDHINCMDNIDCFYTMIISIYILEQYVSSITKKRDL